MSALDDQIRQLAEREPELPAEALILHWFVRNVLMQEDLDAYEFVFDGRRESGGHRFDAGFVGEVEEESGSVSTVVNLVDLFNGSDESQLAKRLQELDAAAGVLDSARLLGAIDELGLSAPRKVVPEKSTLQIHVVAPKVTFARSVLQNTHVYDHQYLERVADALSAPSAIQGFLDVAVDHSQILETAVTSGAVFVCPVSATEIAKWPGIEHRELFDLNVRLKLGTKRVRQSLDEALRSAQGAGDFLASHNGLTVVCDAVEVTDNGLRVTNFSVVNGTQSAIAFFENRHNLDPDIRVLVKFAAVDTTSETARQIAIRSNTQNPVNTRNLRALDARQLALRAEFESLGDYEYEIRPDTHRSSAATVIRNDDAAQLLCALYNERPWLAVKRLALFEQPVYGQIFNPQVSAKHIAFAHRVFAVIQDRKTIFPERYIGAWKLTSLVATYLVGQLMRSNFQIAQLLESPGDVSDELVEGLVDRAAMVLHERADEHTATDRADDYKVDFKREGALRSLGSRARVMGFDGSP